ncbi:hypothetical protein [Micromonospora sp. NPDC050200]|uniref:hypothetical protein n=1 Tax=Micromonospora sp. NPDC050200 TaxID=3155664 RepID=UPI0033C69C45
MVVDELNVVVVLGPIVSQIQHHASFLNGQYRPWQRGRDFSDLMAKCSPQSLQGTSSHQLSSLLTTSGRTVCRKTSKA